MTPLCRLAIALPAALAIAPWAQAASGGIDAFSASASQVSPGDTVDFTVLFSFSTDATSWGGSNTVEPPPADGYQEWSVNWYYAQAETLKGVWLQAGDQSFAGTPNVGAGSGWGGSWSFSITFDQPGSFSIDLTGGWSSEVASSFSSESATRNCYAWDLDNPDALWCDSWSWQYSDASDWYTTEGSLAAGPIVIDVHASAAPVPEPHALALWLAGGGLLAARLRRRATA